MPCAFNGVTPAAAAGGTAPLGSRDRPGLRAAQLTRDNSPQPCVCGPCAVREFSERPTILPRPDNASVQKPVWAWLANRKDRARLRARPACPNQKPYPTPARIESTRIQENPRPSIRSGYASALAGGLPDSAPLYIGAEASSPCPTLTTRSAHASHRLHRRRRSSRRRRDRPRRRHGGGRRGAVPDRIPVQAKGG